MPLKYSKAKQIHRALKELGRTPQQVRRALCDKMLRLWSKIILGKHGRCCVWCTVESTYPPRGVSRIFPGQRVGAHHIVARSISNRLGWFAYDNGMPLCYRCHIHHLKADPDGYIAMRDKWLKAKGLPTYEALRRKYSIRVKLPDASLRVLYVKLQRDAKEGI